MTVARNSRPSRVVRRLRSALMLTTALSFGGAGQAFAQSVVDTGGTSDITVNQSTASGTPTAVQLQTNGGKIDATVTTTTATATDVSGGAVINLRTTGAKAITGNFATITTTGNGDSSAVIANSEGGDITIHAGAIDSTGNFTGGVIANSVSGNVALSGDTLILRGEDFDADGNTGDGMVAITRDGTASINLGRGEVAGNIGSIAAAVTGVTNGLTGGNATVVVGSGKTTGDQGTAVFALVNGLGTASVTTTGTIEATGNSVTGVVTGRSTGGNVVLNAGTTIASGTGTVGTRPLSYTILGQSKTGTVINAGTTSATGFAISGTSSAGDVTITTTGDTHSEFNNAVYVATTNNSVAAVNATVNLGAGTTTSSNATGAISAVYLANITNDATLNSAGTVTAKGTTPAISVNAGNLVTVNSNVVSNTGGGAIYASGTNGTTVNAGTTTAAGNAIVAVSALGDVVVATTGDTASTTGNAIGVSTAIVPNLTAPGGNITISTAAGTLTASQALATGTVGATARGDLTLNLAGKVTGSQTGAATIGGLANGTGKIVATVNEVTNSGTREAIALAGAGGVALTLETAQGSTAGANVVQASSANGNVSLDIGSVTGSSTNNMVNAVGSAANSTVSVIADNVVNGYSGALSQSVFAAGIAAQARGGVTIVAGNVEAQGQAIRALTHINSQVVGEGHISITTTGDVLSRSSNAISIGGFSKSFEVHLAADHVVAGYGGTIVAGGTRAGALGGTLINDGTIEARGAAESAVGFTTHGDIFVKSNIVSVEGLGTPTSMFTAAGFGLNSTGGGSISLESNSATVAGVARYGAYLTTVGAGDITVVSGTLSNDDTDASAIFASAVDGDVTITAGSTTANGENAHAIDAIAWTGDITITSGTASGGGRAIDAYTDSGNIAITTTGNTSSRNDGPAIGADGVDVSIVLGEGTVTDGFEGGIEAEARGDLTIDARGTILGHDDDAIGIAAEVSGDGAATIKSNVIEISGTGEDPGVTNGYRSGQGGIAVLAGNGAVSIDSNSVTVAGDNRYGIYALGNGAIDVKSNTLSYASRDSAGIMILGGAGDVRVTSGTLTATGASGAGIVARTDTGDITLNADQTHLNGTGISGDYTADAVVAQSQSGAVTITSNNASTAGLYGTAVAGIGGSVTITSTTASASGNQGAIVYGQALAGDVTITSGTVTSTGDGTGAIIGRAAGKVAITSGTITSPTAGSTGIQAVGVGGNTVTTGNIASDGYGVRAVSTAGDSTVLVNGAVASANDYGVYVQGGNSAVTVGAGSSVSGKSVGVTGASRTLTSVTNAGTISGGAGVSLGGAAAIANSGTISGTTGPAIVSNGPTSLTNSGTITAGPGALAVALGGQDDLVTLKTGSVVNGVIDGGAGTDLLVLDGTGATASASQTLARSLNFERLDVAAGYWTAQGGQSLYDQVAIASGATLQVDVPNGEAPIGTDEVMVDGLLVLNTSGTAPAEIDELAISGTGGVTLIGTGGVLVSRDMAYTGATTVNGGTLQLTAALAGDVVIGSGGIFRLGDGGTTGTIVGDLTNNGLFIYDRSDSYTIAGDFTGTGALTKNGAGVLTFGGEYGFTGTTTINGGSVKFTGQLAPTTEINLTSGTLDLSEIEGGQQTIGELAGTSSGGVELGSSELVINQATSTSFAGTISGEGGITKTGTGTLNLTGTSDYTGDTNVQGGTLKVNGSISGSTVVMATGGTLGGNGTIGGLSGSGGNVAPGNSIGRLTVAGNIVWNPAFVYQVEVNNAGGADRIDATGTAQLGGATLQVLPEAGRYRGRTTYTILTAAGGVSGTFGTITSSFAFLTPTVSYGATTVTLALTRNNAAFASFGQNGNQVAVAGALQALGAGNALFEETLLLQDNGVSPAFASLTGELHAGISSGRIENAQALRRSLLGRAAPEDAGIYGWASALGNWGNFDKTSRSAIVDTDMTGAMGGLGYSRGGFDIAIGVAGTRSNFTSQGHGDGTSRMIVGSLSYAAGGLWATAGGAYSWDEFDTRRTSSLGAIAQTLTDEYDGRASQFFGELGYGAPVGPAVVGPFVGLSHVDVDSDAIAEAGGSTALNIAAYDRQLTFATAGVKAKAAPFALANGGWMVEPNVSVAYRRAWGDRAETLTAGFVGTAGTFGVSGPVIGRDAAEVGLGIGVTNGRFRINAGYTGTYQKNGSNHSAQISLGFAF